MVQAGIWILHVPDLHSQNMPRCRAQCTQMHCGGDMLPFTTPRDRAPLFGFFCCCILLGMAGCTPQAAAVVQQQRDHAPKEFRQRQQRVGVLQDAQQLQITNKQELQSRQPTLGFSQQQSIEAGKLLQRLGKQEQQQQQQLVGVLRHLLQYKPSPREQEASQKDARHMSGWHVFSITLLCLLAMAALGVIGYKAMQWYERTKRPGYVELQAIDSAYHRPWVSL